MLILTIASTMAFLLTGGVLARHCMNISVSVNISARQGTFGNYPVPMTNADATAFALDATRQGENLTALALTGYATTSGTYNIMTTFCTPNGTAGAHGTTLQILTHGIGFDRTYWDLPFNNYNYSYVDTALASGFSTLTYDRLGLGQSYHASTPEQTRDEIQIFLEIASLAKITKMVRNGNFPSVTTKFNKIVHVGHSFGSAQTYGLTALNPGISDGIVLTGFSMNSSFLGLFTAGADFAQANLNQPLRFGSSSTIAAVNSFSQIYGLFDLINPLNPLGLPVPLDYVNGYLTSANAGAATYQFLLPGRFDPAIGYYAEATKQPVTIGELLTIGSGPMTNQFQGPVLVFTGENDVLFCGGNCFATGTSSSSIPADVKMAFPDTRSFETYIQPHTGHGLTFHYNATAGYQYIQAWLQIAGVSA